MQVLLFGSAPLGKKVQTNFCSAFDANSSASHELHIFVEFQTTVRGTDTVSVKVSKMRMSSNNNVFPVTFDNRNWKWSKVITKTFIKSRFLIQWKGCVNLKFSERFVVWNKKMEEGRIHLLYILSLYLMGVNKLLFLNIID